MSPRSAILEVLGIEAIYQVLVLLAGTGKRVCFGGGKGRGHGSKGDDFLPGISLDK